MYEFLNKLESKLSVLEETERKKILKRYQDKIEKNIANGMSEEEAISALGSLDDIVEELYKEYHINDKYSKQNKGFGEMINGWITSFASMLSIFCKDIAEHVKNNSKENTLELIFEVILKIIVLIMAFMVLKIPFIIVEETFLMVFRLLFYPFNSALGMLLQFILGVMYFACCLGLAIAMFKDYYKKEAVTETKKKEEKVVPVEIEKETAPKEDKNHLFVFIRVILYIIVIIPIICLNLSLLVLTLIAGFLVYKGVSIIGLAILLFGLFLLSTVITSYITDALDNKVKSHTISMVLSLVAIFVGTIVFIDNLANFNYPKDLSSSSFLARVETVTVEVKEPIIISSDQKVKYKIDNSMVDNEILIEITHYKKIVDVRVESYTDAKDEYLLIYSVTKDLQIDMVTYLYENALYDLQNNNIYNYNDLKKTEVTIYCNKTTRELLK